MNEELLRIKELETFRLEHRQLDEQAKDPTLDEFTRKLLQKKKLAMRDKIAELEHMLYPDVIA